MKGKQDHNSLPYRVFKSKKEIKGNNIPPDNKSTPERHAYQQDGNNPFEGR